MQHNAAFHQVNTVCKGKKDLQKKEYNIFLKIITWRPRYVQWTIPSLLYQTKRKNPLEYKGLKDNINSLHTGKPQNEHLSKQSRPRFNATECSLSSESAPFANIKTIFRE